MDIWLARELWHILDNINFYLQQPELLISRKSNATQEEIVQVLEQWKFVCDQTDLLGLRLFWIRDKLGESLLPSGTSPGIIQHYEFFARLLSEQIEHLVSGGEPLTSAYRDTLALSAALGSTYILTHQFPKKVDENSPPGICLALESWGIPCKEIEQQDQIATVERDYLHHLIVQAGFSKYIWGGLRLAVVHLLVPIIGSTWNMSTQVEKASIFKEKNLTGYPTPVKNVWEKVRVFWYQL